MNLVGGTSARPAWLQAFAVIAPLILLVGCAGRALMPTPDVYAEGHKEPFGALAPELQSNRVNLLYATDRGLEQDEEGRPYYGYQRSTSLALGNAVVAIGEDVAWEALQTDSRRRERAQSLPLELVGFNEWARFPESPYPLAPDATGDLVTAPAILKAREQASAALRAELVRRLARTPRKEIFVYVHGYNNSFADAAFTQAEIWHFLGREGVPIIYTWPAGRGGIGGYAYDRESGEFTVFHFKELMRALGRMPEIEGIHILAHSRGTDVTVTGLRELIIEAKAAGLDPLRRYRIKNLILAAPDIDIQVMSQRIVAEKLANGVDRITIYTAIGDKAISLAERLFGSQRRLGRVVWSDVPEQRRDLLRQSLRQVKRIDFVEHKGKAKFFGHGYFHNNPSASSDLILIMRYRAEPGTVERPLKVQAPHFWLLEDGYLGSDRAAPRRAAPIH